MISEGCFQGGGNGIYWLESVQRGKIISQLSIVASQKLVGCSKHINIEWLAFRPFPVKELKHWFILGSTLQVSSNDIKKGFAEVGMRTPLSKITSTGEIEQRFRLN